MGANVIARPGLQNA